MKWFEDRVFDFAIHLHSISEVDAELLGCDNNCERFGST